MNSIAEKYIRKETFSRSFHFFTVFSYSAPAAATA